MGCGACGGKNRANVNWVVTYPGGSTETFSKETTHPKDPGAAARIAAGKVKGATVKAVLAPK